MDKQTAKLGARILENLPGNMSDDVMQGWIDNPKVLQEFLAGLVAFPPQERFLIHHENFVLTGGPLGPSFERGFDPDEFFKTRKGLWVSEAFIDRILSVAEKVMEGKWSELKSWDLRKRATDTEVRAELPENHLVELWQIAKLIEGQPYGEKGPLLTNGYANLFYVKGKGGQVFVVFVLWDADYGWWRVHAWRLGGRGWWHAGYRVFSRN